MLTKYISQINTYGASTDIQYFINTYRTYLFNFISDLYDRYASYHDIDLHSAFKLHRSDDYESELVPLDELYLNAPDYIPPDMLQSLLYDAVIDTHSFADQHSIILQSDTYTYWPEARALSTLYPNITVLHDYGTYDNERYNPIEAIYWKAGNISDHIYCAVTDLSPDPFCDEHFCCTLVRQDQNVNDRMFRIQIHDDCDELIETL